MALSSISKPQGYWNIRFVQRKFLDDLMKKLNIKDQHELYKLSVTTIREHGGHTLLQKYGNSISKMLMSLYPEYLIQNIAS